MCKPQFEAGKEQINKGVIKNEAMRRKILNDFESWLKTKSVVLDKADSETAGEKGNVERFFLVRLGKSSPSREFTSRTARWETMKGCLIGAKKEI